MKTFITFLTENNQHPPHIQEVIDGFDNHFKNITGRKISDCGQLNCAWTTREFENYMNINHPEKKTNSIFMGSSEGGPDHITSIVGEHIVDFTHKPGTVIVTPLKNASHPKKGPYHREGYFRKEGKKATSWMKGGGLPKGIKIGSFDEIVNHMGEGEMTIHAPGKEPPSEVPDHVRSLFAQNPPKR